MSAEEMDNMMEVLYNGIASQQAPGLNAYEKSVFLTKAQNEIVKNYFNAKSKGNTLQEGYDGNAKRQVDFSMLTTVKSITGGSTPLFDTRSNSKSIELPSDMMMAINETVDVSRDTKVTTPVGMNIVNKTVTLQVVPIKFDEYSRLMSKPFKRPLKYQAWRLINNDVKNKADIIIGPSDKFSTYKLRYIRRPKPIIVSYLDGLTIEGIGSISACELDPILHEEIVQRAVELAKLTWDATATNGSTLTMQAGQRSE